MLKHWALYLLSIVLLSTAVSAQSQPQDTALFESEKALNIQIDADLNTLFAQARVLIEQGDLESAKKISVQGQLIYVEPGQERKTVIPVKIEVRGNSSLSVDECTFPKLKIKFDRAHLPTRGLFAGLKKLSLNTHCGEKPTAKPTPKNRIANQLSPLREYYVYRILESLEVPVQKTRLARITYSEQSITRNGLFIEDLNLLASRMGGVVVDTSAPATDWVPGDDPAQMPQSKFKSATESNVDLSLLARLFMAQALIGNYDWGLKVSQADEAFIAIWNAQFIDIPNAQALIVPEDFDLPTILTGRLDLALDQLQNASAESYCHSVLHDVAAFKLKNIKKLFSARVYREQKDFINSKSETIRQVIERSSLDAQGKQIFTQHVDDFFKALNAK